MEHAVQFVIVVQVKFLVQWPPSFHAGLLVATPLATGYSVIQASAAAIVSAIQLSSLPNITFSTAETNAGNMVKVLSCLTGSSIRSDLILAYCYATDCKA